MTELQGCHGGKVKQTVLTLLPTCLANPLLTRTPLEGSDLPEFRFLNHSMSTAAIESSMSNHDDLLVIGSGAAAAATATRMREAGWTAVVDFRPYGGTCALRACDPNEMLTAGDHAKTGPERFTRATIDAGFPSKAARLQ